MRILLDTHVLLWSIGQSKKLPDKVHGILLDSQNEVYFSAASIWEIVIKNALARADFQVDIKQMMETMPETGFVELPITALHANRVAALPLMHKDPFDRILIAQAEVEDMLLFTNDDILEKYSPLARLISTI
jgi:PIN domain nuclease of toxin-antitoxin system